MRGPLLKYWSFHNKWIDVSSYLKTLTIKGQHRTKHAQDATHARRAYTTVSWGALGNGLPPLTYLLTGQYEASVTWERVGAGHHRWDTWARACEKGRETPLRNDFSTIGSFETLIGEFQNSPINAEP